MIRLGELIMIMVPVGAFFWLLYNSLTPLAPLGIKRSKPKGEMHLIYDEVGGRVVDVCECEKGASHTVDGVLTYGKTKLKKHNLPAGMDLTFIDYLSDRK